MKRCTKNIKDERSIYQDNQDIYKKKKNEAYQKMSNAHTKKASKAHQKETNNAQKEDNNTQKKEGPAASEPKDLPFFSFLANAGIIYDESDSGTPHAFWPAGKLL